MLESDHISEPHSWGFFIPTSVHFGSGIRRAVLDLVPSAGCLVVTTPRGRIRFENDPLLSGIAKRTGTQWFDQAKPNPDVSDFNYFAHKLDITQVNSIIAFGGGSVIDAAKAIAALVACRRENISLNRIIAEPTILNNLECPKIHAIPTTSGTGSEVTPFATIWDNAERRKLSLSHAALTPTTAIVDPFLALDVPEDVTLSTALDAINQAFEAVWNKNATPITDVIACHAIRLGMVAITELANDLSNLAARSKMAEASLLAGMCISQTRTALCHSMSYPLTAHFGLPHGIACAFTMKAVAAEIARERPTIINRIANLALYSGPNGLMEHLNEILMVPSVRRQWQELKLRQNEVKALANSMINPGRSDNFILRVDQTLILRLLDESLEQ